ncbi:helix-turn-helix transcriptional regulator [Parasulfitobacter algicola]|uniref:Helix-turn-helix transcriptional regulator n=1 Tax=Parasulfitobacter algicola TaxID=2614809 RepID=A0ABX2IV49_9RHOB|nr:helix-turn-helix transcriptional regulator [Sulfitobacter algicola]NSX56778.1 helix-turn-helix transcriptional regulator [Sulfitobacter algicola]
MKITEASYKKLSAQILSTSLQQENWPLVLQNLSQMAGGARTFLFSHDLFENHALCEHWIGCSDDFVQSWKDYYSSINPWANGAKDVPVGAAFHATQYCPEDQLLQTEFYNDWVKPQENIKHGSAVVAFKDKRVMWLFGGLIRSRDSDKNSEPFHRLLNLLAAQVEHAITVKKKLNELSFERDVFAQNNLRSNAPIIVIRENRKIIHANAAAETLLSNADYLSFDDKGRLELPASSAMRSLEKAIHMIKEHNTHSFTIQNIRDPNQKLDFTLLKFQTSGFDTDAFDLNDIFEETSILLTISEQADEQTEIQNIKYQFGLTNAEASVTYSIYQGVTINEYAQSRSLSIHTVRNQVKAVLSKTGSRRQSDLIRLINKKLNV